MDTLTGLNNLVGKKGLLPVRCGIDHFEVAFTFLSAKPADGLPAETDAFAFQDAITRSYFAIRFDEGTFIDGSNTRMVSGYHISRIMDQT
jgi:hypothetical protein